MRGLAVARRVVLGIDPADERRLVEARALRLEHEGGDALALAGEKERDLVGTRHFDGQVRFHPLREDAEIRGKHDLADRDPQQRAAAQAQIGVFHRLPGGRRADDQRAVVVADDGGNRLGRASRVGVDGEQDRPAEGRVAVGGKKPLLVVARLAQGEERLALGHETADHVGGQFVVAAPARGPQVEHEGGQFLVGEVLERLVEIAEMIARQSTQTDVAGVIVDVLGGKGVGELPARRSGRRPGGAGLG